MNDKGWRGRIVIDPEIHGGDACIRGTRVPVYVVLGALSADHSIDEVCTNYGVSREDVLACLAFAADVIEDGIFIGATTGGWRASPWWWSPASESLATMS